MVRSVRGLARAVAAEQHGELAARHRQINALQDVVMPDVGVARRPA
jgi:hypothetical protein